MKRFDFRIEHVSGGYTDVVAGGMSLEDARARTEEKYTHLTAWDWRGHVAFVSGAKPVEEKLVATELPEATAQFDRRYSV